MPFLLAVVAANFHCLCLYTFSCCHPSSGPLPCAQSPSRLSIFIMVLFLVANSIITLLFFSFFFFIGFRTDLVGLSFVNIYACLFCFEYLHQMGLLSLIFHELLRSLYLLQNDNNNNRDIFLQNVVDFIVNYWQEVAVIAKADPLVGSCGRSLFLASIFLFFNFVRQKTTFSIV